MLSKKITAMINMTPNAMLGNNANANALPSLFLSPYQYFH
jgi:hypothetical protein